MACTVCGSRIAFRSREGLVPHLLRGGGVPASGSPLTKPSAGLAVVCPKTSDTCEPRTPSDYGRTAGAAMPAGPADLGPPSAVAALPLVGRPMACGPVQPPRDTVVADLTGPAFIDCACLGVLVRHGKKIRCRRNFPAVTWLPPAAPAGGNAERWRLRGPGTRGQVTPCRLGQVYALRPGHAQPVHAENDHGGDQRELAQRLVAQRPQRPVQASCLSRLVPTAASISSARASANAGPRVISGDEFAFTLLHCRQKAR